MAYSSSRAGVNQAQRSSRRPTLGGGAAAVAGWRGSARPAAATGDGHRLRRAGLLRRNGRDFAHGDGGSGRRRDGADGGGCTAGHRLMAGGCARHRRDSAGRAGRSSLDGRRDCRASAALGDGGGGGFRAARCALNGHRGGCSGALNRRRHCGSSTALRNSGGGGLWTSRYALNRRCDRGSSTGLGNRGCRRLRAARCALNRRCDSGASTGLGDGRGSADRGRANRRASRDGRSERHRHRRCLRTGLHFGRGVALRSCGLGEVSMCRRCVGRSCFHIPG
ncbi:hypothetical protein BDY17DRAFT_169044 [Neohortaea acidophila]|uniref:Uncharacterized protein n=1 Tax=Neohortaea acidophila TaxID=245834 RepID=A0A6A6PPV8_9PEZI|nr:uncharacterized protein BDY17DRAFT_169044 [Neohortaea acidophila]KAF2481664.1 hypothetical protein BDY17DRAFT_169044 [Neohortaea acidophila]